MTEKEWLACTDPKPMLEFLKGKASDRKLRLFACGCCRLVWYTCPAKGVEMALNIAEALADKVATPVDLAKAQEVVTWAKEEMSDILNLLAEGLEIALQSQPMAVADAATVAERVLSWTTNVPTDVTPTTPSLVRPFRETPSVACVYPPPETSLLAEREVQCRCLRCIFGPIPFRPVRLNLSWLTAAVTYFAQCIYDERDFDCSPIVADALEEAGCTNPDILDHCRGSETHVRGCWVVDILLGKE